MSARPTVAMCIQCGVAPVGKGRRVYCGDYCRGAAAAARDKGYGAKRRGQCVSCGGPKDRVARGVKLCSACKAIATQRHADQQIEAQRRYQAKRSLERAQVRAEMEAALYREGQKWCLRCCQYKDVDQFPQRKDTTKTTKHCRPCQRAYNRERRLAITFGMSWDDYELLLACQDNRCAICGGRPRKHMLAVDHDHATGEIRGLLCSRCNHRLLGAANDDPARLRRAANYLEEFSPRDVFGRQRFIPGSGPTP